MHSGLSPCNMAHPGEASWGIKQHRSESVIWCTHTPGRRTRMEKHLCRARGSQETLFTEWGWKNKIFTFNKCNNNTSNEETVEGSKQEEQKRLEWLWLDQGQQKRLESFWLVEEVQENPESFWVVQEEQENPESFGLVGDSMLGVSSMVFWLTASVQADLRRLDLTDLQSALRAAPWTTHTFPWRGASGTSSLWGPCRDPAGILRGSCFLLWRSCCHH